MRSLKRRIGWTVALICAALVAYLLLWPTPIEPAAWDAPDPPALDGPYAVNEDLRRAERIAEGAIRGPEDVEVDGQGRIYGGTDDGRVVRIDPDTERVETFAETGGRPLGMMFDAGGDLIVCDAFEGLLAIGEDGAIDVLATEAGGTPLTFTNDLDIGEDGAIYFTDASTRFGQDEYTMDLFEARPHGRFLRHDRESGETRVLAEDLYFANGVALAEDESFALVNETYRYRIRKVWLEEGREGETEVVADNLPGFPDNINRSSAGTFWLALFTVRNDMMDWLHARPFLKNVVARLPDALRPEPEPYGFVLEVDEDGDVLRTLQDPGGEVLAEVTSVKERRGALYLGTLYNPWVGRLEL